MANLLDVGQAAAYLTIKPGYVRRLVRERRIPYVKVGKFVRFEQAELDEWLVARRVEPLP